METDLIKELLTAFFGAVGGALAGLTFSSLRKYFSFSPMLGRQKGLTGRWTGSACQVTEAGEPIDFSVSLELKAGRRRIRGTGRMETRYKGEEREANLKIIDGGFKHDQFLTLEYENTDPVVRQFGTLIGQLNLTGTQIHTTFAGIGAVTNEPASGRVIFEKD